MTPSASADRTGCCSPRRAIARRTRRRSSSGSVGVAPGRPCAPPMCRSRMPMRSRSSAPVRRGCGGSSTGSTSTGSPSATRRSVDDPRAVPPARHGSRAARPGAGGRRRHRRRRHHRAADRARAGRHGRGGQRRAVLVVVPDRRPAGWMGARDVGNVVGGRAGRWRCRHLQPPHADHRLDPCLSGPGPRRRLGPVAFTCGTDGHRRPPSRRHPPLRGARIRRPTARLGRRTARSRHGALG